MEGGILVKEARAAVLTMEGTNNEEEAYLSLSHAGALSEIVHIKKFENGLKKIQDYDILFFPGGFSAGDYVRAGAIMASRLKASIMGDLEDFIEEGKLIMGSCNGFQVIIELGLIPNIGESFKREAALAPNLSNRFEARTVYLKVNNNKSPFLRKFERGNILKLPIAHAEGRFIVENNKILEEIRKNEMIALTYVNPEGIESGYPWNPNGSVLNIAGIHSKNGNIFGLMPHPERAFTGYTQSDWTRGEIKDYGKIIFESAIEYVKEKF